MQAILTVFLVLFNFSVQMLKLYLKIIHDHFVMHLFQFIVHFHCVIQLYISCVVEKASLNQLASESIEIVIPPP
jgi:hypothetical protein